MPKATFLLLICLLGFLNASHAQKSLDVAGMHMIYQLVEDSITIQLRAPTRGWVAIGFNEQEGLVGSDLLMFAVIDGKIIYSDQFVRAFQDHPEDSKLGGQNNIRLLDYFERQGETSVRFRIPLQSGSQDDFQHEPGTGFQLTLAYSVSDDFQHHSRVRKQLEFSW